MSGWIGGMSGVFPVMNGVYCAECLAFYTVILASLFD
jgi:hypothetical protein